MSETELKRKKIKIEIDPEKVKKAIKRLFSFQTIIFLLIAFSILFSIAFTTYKIEEKIADIRYDPELAELSNLGVSLVVEWRNETVSTFPLENNLTIAMKDAESQVISFSYLFEISNLELSPSWNQIHLFFQIEEKAFSSYPYIECKYVIEDKSELIRKDAFEVSREGFNFFIAKIDIDRWMFKDAVPTAISAEISLFNL